MGAKFAMLADPSWVATAMAYITDCVKLDEARRKLGKGAGKGKDPQDESSLGAPPHQRFLKLFSLLLRPS